MLRKIVSYFILVPLGLVIIAFAVANRQIVTVSFDPFTSAHPAYAARAPLFVLIFVLVILGVIIGGIATWLKQHKWRRVARRLHGELRELHDENVALRRRLAETEPGVDLGAVQGGRAQDAPPPLQLRPPAA
jgi:uncharacterized integral membrane protein